MLCHGMPRALHRAVLLALVDPLPSDHVAHRAILAAIDHTKDAVTACAHKFPNFARVTDYDDAIGQNEIALPCSVAVPLGFPRFCQVDRLRCVHIVLSSSCPDNSRQLGEIPKRIPFDADRQHNTEDCCDREHCEFGYECDG